MKRTYEEAIREAGQHLATARRVADTMTPRQLAEAAWHVGSPYSIDELEDLIRGDRGLDLVHGNDLAELQSRDGRGSPKRRRKEDLT